MMKLALAGLRSRLTAFAGTFLAAVLAVALVGGASTLLFSVLTAEPVTDRFHATPIMVGGDREISLESVQDKGKGKVKRKVKTERLSGAPVLPTGWAAQIRGIAGVEEVIEDYSFLATLDGRAVTAHNWASAALDPVVLHGGHSPGAGEIIVPQDVEAQEVSLTTRTGQVRLRVAGHGPGGRVFVADADAARLSGLSGPTAIGVKGSESLRGNISQTLGTANVYIGQDKARADLPSALPDYIGAISIFGFVIGISLFAAVFVLTGTVGLAVRQRLRELALLRATGATPRQLLRMLRLETLIVSLAATLAGAPLGLLAAQAIAARFRALGTVPAQFEPRLNVAVLLAGGALITIAAQVSAGLAARRATRIAPAQALQETMVEGRIAWAPRALAATVCTVGAFVLLAVVPLDGPMGMGITFISSALLLCAVAAAGPILTRIVGRVLAPVAGWLGGPFARAENRRVAAIAVPLALMFAINAPLLLNGALTQRLAQEQAVQRGTVATVPTRLIVDENGKPEDYQAQGLASTGTAASLEFVAGGWSGDGLAVSRYLAGSLGWSVGERVRVWFPDATEAELPVTGVYELSRGFGDLVVNADLAARHDPRGFAVAAVAGDAAQQQGAWEIMIVISLGFTAIAVANTFALAAAARRPQLRQLRLIGATRRQLRRMAARETAHTVAIGLILGLAVTWIVVGAFGLANGAGLSLVPDWPGFAGLLALACGVGMISGLFSFECSAKR